MRVLFVTNSIPHGKTTGAEVGSMNFIEAIREEGVECDVVGYWRHGDIVVDKPGYFSPGKWHIEIASAGRLTYYWMAKAILTHKPFITTKFMSGMMRAQLRKLVREKQYDVLVIDHTQLGWLLDETYLPKRRIFLAHNVEWRVYDQMSRNSHTNNALMRLLYKREGRMVRGFEARLARECDQTWTVTESDADDFRNFTATGKVRPFGQPGEQLPSLTAHVTPTRDVGILGAWMWEVNRIGLEWFMREVVPKIPADIEIDVAGRGADQIPNSNPNVTYCGFVPDAGEFLRQHKVICVPTVEGGGIQIKTITGISAGVPMVATPLGLRGISDAPDFVHIAPTPDLFAAKIAELVGRSGDTDTSAGTVWATERRNRFRENIRSALTALAN